MGSGISSQDIETSSDGSIEEEFHENLSIQHETLSEELQIVDDHVADDRESQNISTGISPIFERLNNSLSNSFEDDLRLQLIENIEPYIRHVSEKLIQPNYEKLKEIYDQLISNDVYLSMINSYQLMMEKLSEILNQNSAFATGNLLNSSSSVSNRYQFLLENAHHNIHDLTDHLPNNYSISTGWTLHKSHQSLDFSINCDSVNCHINLGAQQPLAISTCTSKHCSITVQLDQAPLRDGYFSFGLVVNPKAQHDVASVINTGGPLSYSPSSVSIADITDMVSLSNYFLSNSLDNIDFVNHVTPRCIGQMPMSWGIHFKCNNFQPCEIWAQGIHVANAPQLQSGDKLSLYIDNRHDSTTFNAGYCHLLMNDCMLYTFTGLDTNLHYLNAMTLCAGYAVTILPKDLTTQFVMESNHSPSIQNASSSNTFNQVILNQTNRTEQSSPVIIDRTPPVPPFFPHGKSTLQTPNKNKKITQKGEHHDEDSSSFCCVCMENPKCVVLLPCKHLCVCDHCVDPSGSKTASYGKLKVCPICREMVVRTMKVFL